VKDRLLESLYMHNKCSPQPHSTHPVLPHRRVVLPRNQESRYTEMAHIAYVDWLCRPSAVAYYTTRLPTTLVHYAHASRHRSTLTLRTSNPPYAPNTPRIVLPAPALSKQPLRVESAVTIPTSKIEWRLHTRCASRGAGRIDTRSLSR
jgi:hypothetical protein